MYFCALPSKINTDSEASVIKVSGIMWAPLHINIHLFFLLFFSSCFFSSFSFFLQALLGSEHFITFHLCSGVSNLTSPPEVNRREVSTCLPELGCDGRQGQVPVVGSSSPIGFLLSLTRLVCALCKVHKGVIEQVTNRNCRVYLGFFSLMKMLSSLQAPMGQRIHELKKKINTAFLKIIFVFW
jgi:hypothetical protein